MTRPQHRQTRAVHALVAVALLASCGGDPSAQSAPSAPAVCEAPPPPAVTITSLPQGRDYLGDGRALFLRRGWADLRAFTSCHTPADCGLWLTNGTPEGTRRAIPAGEAERFEWIRDSSDVLGERLMVFANEAGSDCALFTSQSVCQLWSLGRDGTVEEVARISSGPQPYFGPYRRAGGRFYVMGMVGETCVWWGSDGTPAGTHQLTPAARGYCPDFGQDRIGELDDAHALLLVENADEQTELWVSDGTPEGTSRVSGFAVPGRTSVSFVDRAGGLLYLRVTQADTGTELWRTDGTGAGTWMLEVSPGAGDGVDLYHVQTEVLAVNGVLVFRANDGVHGWQLWRTDGTRAGTAMWTRLPGGVRASSLLGMGGATYVHGADGTAEFLDRVSEDGASLQRVFSHLKQAPLPEGERWDLTGYPSMRPLVLEDQGRMLFALTDAEHGAELWVTDGTAQGTRLVQDLVPGPGSSWPERAERIGSRVVFAAGAVGARQVWSLPVSALAAAPGAGSCADTPQVPAQPPEDAGCAASPGAGAWLVVLLAGWRAPLFRRRRYPPSHGHHTRRPPVPLLLLRP